MKKRGEGKGLSLEAFASAKSRPLHNPSEIKKKREFYQNAKKVRKYKKLKKELDLQRSEQQSDSKVDGEDSEVAVKITKKDGCKKGGFDKLRRDYEKKLQEIEDAKQEQLKQNAARQQAREQSQRQRKQATAKMFKKTSRGQPVMKHRLEQILRVVESSKSQ